MALCCPEITLQLEAVNINTHMHNMIRCQSLVVYLHLRDVDIVMKTNDDVMVIPGSHDYNNGTTFQWDPYRISLAYMYKDATAHSLVFRPTISGPQTVHGNCACPPPPPAICKRGRGLGVGYKWLAGLVSRVCMAGLDFKVCPGGTKYSSVDSPGGMSTA